MERTIIVGVDCATVNSKVGLAWAVADDEGCTVRFAGPPPSENELAQEIASWLTKVDRALVAFDAPLGWPLPMGAALTAHRAGSSLTVGRNELFRRATDRFVKGKLGKQSLDVGADRIARTAHSALELLGRLRHVTALPIPLAWESTFDAPVAAIEVYPAASLVAHGVPDTGYKDPKSIAARKSIIGELDKQLNLPSNKAAMELSADVLDAVVCILAGYDFLRGEAYPPEVPELAHHEGWIWVRPRVRVVP